MIALDERDNENESKNNENSPKYSTRTNDSCYWCRSSVIRCRCWHETVFIVFYLFDDESIFFENDKHMRSVLKRRRVQCASARDCIPHVYVRAYVQARSFPYSVVPCFVTVRPQWWWCVFTVVAQAWNSCTRPAAVLVRVRDKRRGRPSAFDVCPSGGERDNGNGSLRAGCI